MFWNKAAKILIYKGETEFYNNWVNLLLVDGNFKTYEWEFFRQKDSNPRHKYENAV